MICDEEEESLLEYIKTVAKPNQNVCHPDPVNKKYAEQTYSY